MYPGATIQPSHLLLLFLFAFSLMQPDLDPYDNPLTMSLAEFAAHPIAAELLHNGQTFQVRLTAGMHGW
jgi:hypothetical protein